MKKLTHAKQGEESYIGIKINSLTDKAIITKLVEASQAGVKIEMIVRGICCLIPGIEGYTENIKVVSIVGRLPGAFQNLPFWNERAREGLSCIRRFHDKKYQSAVLRLPLRFWMIP